MPRGRDATHRFLYFDLEHSAQANQEDFHYIDIGRMLSMVNRRLYRQGMVYHVANVSIHDSDADCEVRFTTAPNTWYLRRAWFEVFRAWKKQRAQALDNAEVGVQTGKWSDFKVYLNLDHVTDVDWPLPLDCEQDSADLGEWNYADIATMTAGNEYKDHAVVLMGNHTLGTGISSETSPDDSSYDGTISCLKALQQIWEEPDSNEPDTPSSVSTSVLLGMNLLSMGADAQLDDILDDVEDENDTAPYSSNFQGIGGSMTAPWVVRETEIDGGSGSAQKMAHVGGFPVPCGLLCVETKGAADYSGNDNENTIGICIELAPGDYQGVSAEEMW